MNPIHKPYLIDLHRRRWSGLWLWLAVVAAFFLAEGLLGWSLLEGPIWLTVLLVLFVAHLMHAHLLAFHEAVHRILCPNRFLNEFVGTAVGTLSFTPFSAFRALHHTHHHHLATERDEELWPFVVPGTPRWQRRLAALFELTLGIVYTPCLCYRFFLRRGSPIRGRTRRRVWLETGLILVWTALVVTAALTGLGRFLLILYVIPGILAGDMHSLRKYIEHMGLAGSTPLGSTRSVVPEGPLGRLVTSSMFNISYHGIHHRYAMIPQERLPELAGWLAPTQADELPTYRHYAGAFRDMVRSLADPRIGAQWLRPTSADVEKVLQ